MFKRTPSAPVAPRAAPGRGLRRGLRRDKLLPSKAARAALDRTTALSGASPRAAMLAHELHVHQLELEMQNDELRRTQRALEQTRDRFTDLYEFAPVGYLTLDAQGHVIQANLTSARMLCMERGRMLNRPFSLCVVPEERDGWYRHAKAMAASAEGARVDLRLLRGDGREFDAQLDCLHDVDPLRARPAGPADASAGKRGMRITLLDITDRHRTDAELRLAAAAFETMEGTMITDAGGVIERVNKAFSQLTGYSADEAVGRSANLLRSSRHAPAFYAELWASLARAGGWSGEIWNRHKSGEVSPQWLTITAVPDSDGRTHRFVGTVHDISERKSREAAIEQLAFYDALTGLPNRRLMKDRLQQALAVCARTQRSGALMFIDLDHFKGINDALGHDAGDRLLQQVAQRLSGCVRECDTVARLGGDEFVVVLAADLSADGAEAARLASVVAQKVVATLRRPYRIGGAAYTCCGSVGLTVFNDHDISVDELLRRADQAMYQSKSDGRDTVRLFESFDSGAQAEVLQRSAVSSELRRAVEQGEFVLLYQPVVDDRLQALGAEALVRWQHPQRGLLPPGLFIPLAEETGLILGLGRWVLETACKQLAAWSADADTAELVLSVNVSAAQLRDPGFVAMVLDVVDRTGARATHLRLELTETMMLDTIDETVLKMNLLKDHGVGFSLDDFGTGYASLTLLKRLPVDQVKIDRSFVHDMMFDPQDAAIARAVTELGIGLGLTVIAEGVETQAQRDRLFEQGCRAFQGHLYGRAQSAQALLQTIRHGLPAQAERAANAP